MTPTSLAAYLVLFVAVGIVFLAANLLVGMLLRPHSPSAEKGEIYECGEPTIGTSQVRFDLRFYVVALVFLVFDVEVAFFFPWAVVFGTSTQMLDPTLPAATITYNAKEDEYVSRPTPPVVALYKTLGAEAPTGSVREEGQGRYEAIVANVQATGKSLAWMSLFDMLIFFAVLIVGFAYVWKRGDLEWVRAYDSGPGHETSRPLVDLSSKPQGLVATIP